MKFEEILPILKDGHGICRASWDSLDQLKLINDQLYILYENDDMIDHYGIYAHDLLADDWELFGKNKL